MMLSWRVLLCKLYMYGMQDNAHNKQIAGPLEIKIHHIHYGQKYLTKDFHEGTILDWM